MVKNFKSYLVLIVVFLISGCGGGEDETYNPPVIVTPTSLNCPSGQVAKGITVRLGEIVDKLTLNCAVLSYGYPSETGTDAESVGGSGGSLKEAFSCPSAYGIRSVSGYNGRTSWAQHLASIQVTCSDEAGLEKSPNYMTATGNSQYSFSCGNNQFATGFDLNLVTSGSNSYVGFITGIKCSDIPT